MARLSSSESARGTACFTFAGSTVVVQAVGARACSILDLLFGRVPTVKSADAAGDDAIALRIVETTSGLDVTRGAVAICRGGDEGAAASLLLGEVMYALADRCTTGVLFHAAAVARDCRAILLPGRSHSGKTTLAAWLAPRCGYVTDEMVFMPLDAGGVQPFSRPLQLRHAAREALAADTALLDHRRSVSGSDFDLVVLPDLSVPSARPLDLQAIIFPRYNAASAGEVTKLSQAQTGLALMECVLNVRNRPEQIFAAVAAVARRAPAYRMTYSSLTQVERDLNAIVDAL